MANDEPTRDSTHSHDVSRVIVKLMAGHSQPITIRENLMAQGSACHHASRPGLFIFPSSPSPPLSRPPTTTRHVLRDPFSLPPLLAQSHACRRPPRRLRTCSRCLPRVESSRRAHVRTNPQLAAVLPAVVADRIAVQVGANKTANASLIFQPQEIRAKLGDVVVFNCACRFLPLFFLSSPPYLASVARFPTTRPSLCLIVSSSAKRVSDHHPR